jgi:hypothetical protein
MSRNSLNHGVVTISALDVRRHPEHASEMRNQLLLGETVRILKSVERGKWLQIRSLEDGYEGWIRSWGVVAASAERASVWRRKARTRVSALFVEARAEPGRGGLVGPLFWQSRFIAGRPVRGHRRVEFPDGRRGWVPSDALAGSASCDLHDRVLSLLGVPYLWGGRTPAGLDCSGFTQLLLFEQGVSIPRDADQQHRACRPVPSPDDARAGDLIFFSEPGRKVSHVGIWLGDGVFAHARGQVRIGSIHRRNPFYDKDLTPQVRGIGRPPSRRSGAHPGSLS